MIIRTIEYQNRILKRKDVAQILNLSTRAIDLMAKNGTLRKITLPNRIRAMGFLESEVMKLLENK